jgi:ABC-2 type transport system permease protein
MRTIRAVAVKELKQIIRDKRTLVILVFVPTFFLFLYGYALNFDVRHVALAVDDRDHTAESRTLINLFARSTYFDVVATPSTDAEVSSVIDRRVARVVLVVPEGFGRTVLEGQTSSVQLIVDGDNANTAATVLAYVSGVLRQAEAGWGRAPVASLVVPEPRVWYNPELRSTVFLVPGLIAFISMITAVVSTALSIVREVEQGTIEQIRMAPVSTASFVIGKTVPYLVLSEVGAMAIIGAAMVFFDLPMRGNWLALAGVVALFLVGALGTGILVSTIAPTQDVAFQLAALIAMLPTMILSGFIFPIASMPIGLQYISSIVPAKYFLIALRGVVLKGLDLPSVWPALVALCIYAAATLGLSALRLARR